MSRDPQHRDPFRPGWAHFSFGASFNQDPTPPGVPASDGDNLIQRGLYSQTGQFKIDIDHGRPSCRVAGSTGALTVRAQMRTAPHTWYRAECFRTWNRIELRMYSLTETGEKVEIERVSKRGSLGSVKWAKLTPLAVGGKLIPEGRIVRSDTDQFNGMVADPFLVIDGR